MFLMLPRLFIAALWSPARKVLTSWLLLVKFIVFLLFYHVVSWVRCCTRLCRFLIFVVFLTLKVYNLRANSSEPGQTTRLYPATSDLVLHCLNGYKAALPKDG